MLLAPKTPALRRWRLWFGALVIAEIGWFALMRPPFHGHFRSLVLLALIPIAVVGYVYLLAAVAVYLDRLDWDYQMRQLIVVLLGLSVGLFVFALMTISTAQLEASAAGCPQAGCAEAEEPTSNEDSSHEQSVLDRGVSLGARSAGARGLRQARVTRARGAKLLLLSLGPAQRHPPADIRACPGVDQPRPTSR